MPELVLVAGGVVVRALVGDGVVREGALLVRVRARARVRVRDRDRVRDRVAARVRGCTRRRSPHCGRWRRVIRRACCGRP